MRKKIKQTFQILLLIISTLTVQQSFGQNLFLLHDKIGKGDCVVRTGKKVKVETLDKQIIKGKLIDIKDSTIVIANITKTEIKLTNIKYFHYRVPSGWKTAGGIFLGYSALSFTAIVIAVLSENAQANQNGGTYDNPVSAFAVIGVIVLPALYAGTYYGLWYKKKFDTQLRYDLTIIKHK